MNYNVDYPTSVDQMSDSLSWESGDTDEPVLQSQLESAQLVAHEPSSQIGESQDRLKKPHWASGNNDAKDACREVLESILNDAIEFSIGDQAHNVIYALHESDPKQY